MSRPKNPSARHQLLSSKKLAEIAKRDSETPSLWRFLVFEAIEWLLIAGILFALYVAARTIWQNVTPQPVGRSVNGHPVEGHSAGRR